MGERMRAFPWHTTHLGPADSWPQSLKTAVRIMLTSRQPIWIGWGEQLTYLYNDPYKAIIGGKHPNALGQPTARVWNEIWDDIGPLLAKAGAGAEGTYVEGQLLIMERNGYPEETYYTFSYTPIPDDQGAPGGIICANTDDTRRVIGERQLAMLRDLATGTADLRSWQEVCVRAAAALETNPRDIPFAMVYMLEPGGRTLSLMASASIRPNHPAAPQSVSLDDSSPWPFADVLSSHAAHLVEDLREVHDLPRGGWSRPPSRAIALPLAASGKTERAGVLIVGLNPYRLPDEEYLGFLKLAAGQISAAVAIAEAYEQERRRATALAELDAAKTAFFSNVSHEFRTPLTLLLSPTEDALASATDPAQKQRLEVVHRSALRLQKLVNALLDFSRIEAGRTQAKFRPTDLPRATSELASVFRSAIERAGMTLLIDCPPLSGDPVYIDRDMYEKIVLNLLSNAFKHTFEGEIEVSLRDRGDAVVLAVRDTGVGIAQHELPRLFERFHRVEGARARTHEGSGIGLALVNELAKLHQARIEVVSTPGKGSTFTVEFAKGYRHLSPDHIETDDSTEPAIPAAIRAEAFADEAMRWLPETTDADPDPAAQRSGEEGPPERILLADDNADMREYVRRLLLASGYEVESVPDGAAALDAARRRRPDLIISDVMMPVLDGFELLREIRADAQIRDVPMILLSARAGEESRVEGLRAGADDYLVKPFSSRELVARVSSHLQLARVRREGEAREHSLRREAESLNEVALTVGAELDLTSLVQKVTDSARELTHAQFAAFFYNTTDQRGESYVLYTLSGAPREAFEKFGMPRATHLFGPTFRGEGVIRIDDVLQDPRYGKNPPHHGMPKGHPPVRSYLAAPVTARSGEVIGGLFFGHASPGVFTERAERIALGIASQAAIAIDNARLYGQAQREISDRRSAEEAVLRREAQLNTILDRAPMGICLVDADLRVRHVNPVALPLFSDAAAIPGADIRDALLRRWPAEIAEDFIHRIRLTLETGEPGRVPELVRRPEGLGPPEYYDWQSHRVPLPDGTSGAVCYFTDVTSHVRGRRALAESEDRLRQTLDSERAARTEAERAGRMKDEFLATLSHELRTPLNAILGWTSILRRQPTGHDRVSQGLEVIERNARVQTQLISDLLDMSRIISGKMRLDVQRVELPVVIEAALEAVRPAAEAREVRLQSVLEPISEPVHGDPARLQQIVWNLLSNAVKFTPKTGRVQIVLARVNSHVEISVSDTGKGIRPEFLPHVFERFRQADSSASREHGGLGLGLSIVKQLVELHGGVVRAASDGEGKGATFTVHLPLAAVHQAATGPDRVHPRANSLSPVSGDQPDLRGVLVLVVDDEPDSREIVMRVLEDCHASVIAAGSAQEALAKLERERPDVLLSDIGMAGVDGYAFIRALRRKGNRIPAAALTAFARSEDRTRALLAGYQTHLAKPVEPSELLATVAVLAQKTSPDLKV
jgi:signal transduction histidine kinase/DNA-binding response OmpR family regulator